MFLEMDITFSLLLQTESNMQQNRCKDYSSLYGQDLCVKKCFLLREPMFVRQGHLIIVIVTGQFVV